MNLDFNAIFINYIVNNNLVIANNTFYKYYIINNLKIYKKYSDVKSILNNLLSTSTDINDITIDQYDFLYNAFDKNEHINNFYKNYIFTLDLNILSIDNKLFNFKTNDFIQCLPNKKINFSYVESNIEYSLFKFLKDNKTNEDDIKLFYYIIGSLFNNHQLNKFVFIYTSYEVSVSLYKLIINLYANYDIEILNQENYIKNRIYFITDLKKNCNILINSIFVDMSSISIDKIKKLNFTSNDIFMINDIYINYNIDSFNYKCKYINTLNPIQLFINSKCVINDKCKSMTKTHFKTKFTNYYSNIENISNEYTNFNELLIYTLEYNDISFDKSHIFNLSIL